MINDPLARAARAILEADGLLIAAGAGMGVDSGLPDFRGKDGFWRAYPALARAAMGFTSIASPAAFEADPKLAWGFYGHRLDLYRKTVPHDGFRILRDWGGRLAQGAFVFTSNVDGQFQKAGFPGRRVVEVHGSIHHLQCQHDCRGSIWPADDFVPVVDEARCLLMSDYPICPDCGEIARPNILMFGDWQWIDHRAVTQQAALTDWLNRPKRLVVVELGAGTEIATVRHFSESLPGTLIRINPTDPTIPGGKGISLKSSALAALTAVNDLVVEARRS